MTQEGQQEFSPEVMEQYAFPQDLTAIDRYIEMRERVSQKEFDYSIFTDMLPAYLAFGIGTVFAYRALTPLGSAARMIKEQRQGRAVYLMNRVIPLFCYGYFSWSVRNDKYKPNPYSTGQMS